MEDKAKLLQNIIDESNNKLYERIKDLITMLNVEELVAIRELSTRVDILINSTGTKKQLIIPNTPSRAGEVTKKVKMVSMQAWFRGEFEKNGEFKEKIMTDK